MPGDALLVEHLHAQAPEFGLNDDRAAARGTAALIAAFVGPRVGNADVLRQAMSPVTMGRLRQLMETHLGGVDLGPEFLMRRAAMSRAALYRLFEPLGGVRNYIQQRRLTRAFQMITDPSHADERVGAIARRRGFSLSPIADHRGREAEL